MAHSRRSAAQESPYTLEKTQTVVGDGRVFRHCVYALANAVAAGIVHKTAHWKGSNSLRMEYGKEYVVSKPRVGLWSKKAALEIHWRTVPNDGEAASQALPSRTRRRGARPMERRRARCRLPCRDSPDAPAARRRHGAHPRLPPPLLAPAVQPGERSRRAQARPLALVLHRQLDWDPGRLGQAPTSSRDRQARPADALRSFNRPIPSSLTLPSAHYFQTGDRPALARFDARGRPLPKPLPVALRHWPRFPAGQPFLEKVLKVFLGRNRFGRVPLRVCRGHREIRLAPNFPSCDCAKPVGTGPSGSRGFC